MPGSPTVAAMCGTLRHLERGAVPKELLDRLRCPACRAEMLAPSDATVRCSTGHEFSLERGYLDTSVDQTTDRVTAQTFESFGYEWNAFADVRDEDAEFARIYFRDLDWSSLEGKVGLDAGCGKGRFTRFVAPHIEALAALDGSSAVEAAVANLRDMPNVLVVRSDLRDPPFATESFDFVMCLGVLHHLENPRAGFDRLLEYLAPGGTLVIYVYSRPSRWGVRRAALAAASALRRTTVHLPHRLLKLCSIPIAYLLYGAFVMPGKYGADHGVGVLDRLPMTAYRGRPARSLVLDTFDRLSAPVEYRYVWSELEPWFAEAGLDVLAARDEAGWFVVARKR